MSGTNNPPKVASENTLRELVENITCDLPDGFTYLDDEHTKVVDAIMQAFTATMETVLSSLKQSVKQHTVPEGKHLVTRSYVLNSIEFERKRLTEMVGKTNLDEGANV